MNSTKLLNALRMYKTSHRCSHKDATRFSEVKTDTQKIKDANRLAEVKINTPKLYKDVSHVIREPKWTLRSCYTLYECENRLSCSTRLLHALRESKRPCPSFKSLQHALRNSKRSPRSFTRLPHALLKLKWTHRSCYTICRCKKKTTHLCSTRLLHVLMK